MEIYIPNGLRITLVIVSLLVATFVVVSSRKAKMDVRYAVLWIVWAVFVLVIAIKPIYAVYMAQSIGFNSVTNFIMMLMIAILFMFNYYMYLVMSKLSRENKKLNYEVALLKQKYELRINTSEKDNNENSGK